MRMFLMVAAGILGLAMALTGVGLTGSSFGMLDRLGVVSTGSRHIYGEPQVYRGDEWGVHTPTAVAQYNHTPPFPVINTNTGILGTNMLLVHMTGVPVSHVSALVKPATWGFFFLPLENALAWYWWCPIALGILGFFSLLRVLFPQQGGMSLVVSAGFTFSMHSVAFSHWPAYIGSFAWFAAALLILLLRTTSVRRQYVCGLGLGLSLSALLMTLYMPWIIACLWLAILVTLVVFFSEKLYRQWTRHTLGALALAIAVVLFFALAWYLSTKDALSIIAASSYPGRRFVTGGDWPLWGLAKGWMSLTTLNAGALLYDGKGYNLYPYMYVPLLAVLGKMLFARPAERESDCPAADPVTVPLLVFLALGMGFIAMYQYAGIPAAVARWTGLAFSHGFGVEIFIGAAQMLFFVGLVQASPRFVPYTSTSTAGIAGVWCLILAILSFSAGLNASAGTPLSSAALLLRGVLAMSLALGLSWALLRGHIRAVILAYTGSVLLVTLPFNPLYYAAKAITPLAPPPVHSAPALWQSRVLMLNMTGQNHMWAAGYKVFNTTQYYADMAIYDLLYKDDPEAEKYQKYNFMNCTTGSVESEKNYKLKYTPDGNHIAFDGERFNFGQLPIDYVLIPSNSMDALKNNPSVHLESLENNLAWFRVRAAAQE